LVKTGSNVKTPPLLLKGKLVVGSKDPGGVTGPRQLNVPLTQELAELDGAMVGPKAPSKLRSKVTGLTVV
jgi:hypothetical protein